MAGSSPREREVGSLWCCAYPRLGGSHFSTVFGFTRSPFTERAPSLAVQASSSLALSCATGTGPFFPSPRSPRDTFSPSAILPITKGVSCTKIDETEPSNIVFESFSIRSSQSMKQDLSFGTLHTMLRNLAKSFCWKEHMSFFFLNYILHGIKRFPLTLFRFVIFSHRVPRGLLASGPEKSPPSAHSANYACKLNRRSSLIMIIIIALIIPSMRKREVINRRDNIVTTIVHEREKWRR